MQVSIFLGADVKVKYDFVNFFSYGKLSTVSFKSSVALKAMDVICYLQLTSV